MSTTYEKLGAILTKEFSVAEEKIQPDATLESMGLDSLDYIELLFEVEDAFHIQIPQDGASAVKAANVQDIVDNIDKLVATGQSPPEPTA